jgi:replicative DNA helicase
MKSANNQHFTTTSQQAGTGNPPQVASNYLPPQKLDIEAAVLGAALLEQPASRKLLSLIQKEEVFYKAEHRLVFATIRELAAERQPLDQLTVVSRLRAKGTLQRAGGVGFVAGLTMHINSAAHLEGHCYILLESYLRRAIISTATRIQQQSYDEMRDPLELLSEASNQLRSVHLAIDRRPARTVADHFQPMFEKLRADVLRRGLTGIPTGLTDLNDATGGWQPGDLIVLAARPAMGKTAVMLHMARAASLDHELHTAIFSLEMPAQQLVQRMVASEVPGYANSDLRKGNLIGGLEQVAHLEQQAQRLAHCGHRLHIDDTSGLTINQLRAKCTALHDEHPLSLVLVDYIQLMQGEQKSRNGNREQEISSISRGLKELAKELNVPVIALSQLSREVEKRGGQKRPQLSDLRESGAIEQDADMIVFLWRGEYYKISEYDGGSPTTDTLLFDIAKHRNGNVGEIIVGCQMSRGMLCDLY